MLYIFLDIEFDDIQILNLLEDMDLCLCTLFEC